MVNVHTTAIWQRKIQLATFEQTLDAKFPSSYRQFVLDCGATVLDGFKILGLSTETVAMSVLEGTQILRTKRPDLLGKSIAISINGTKALCLDLEKGSEEDAPLSEVDLTQKEVSSKLLGKTFGEWIEKHEIVSKRFSVAWNRVRSRQSETPDNKQARWSWDTTINRIKDYIVGVAAFRHNPIQNCLEVDELYPVNQPHVKKGEPIRILMNEIFASARDYSGSLQIVFTRDIREDETGKIPEKCKTEREQRKATFVPKELVDFAEKYKITFEGQEKGIISHKEGVELWFASLELPPEIKEEICKLEKAEYLSKEIIAEIISKGIWTKEELVWIFLNAPRPETLLLGSDAPEDRLFYSESINYGRAALLAVRFKEAIIAELTKGVSIEEIEKENLNCVLESKKDFWVLKCNKDFSLPKSWMVSQPEKLVKADEPVLLVCRPCFPADPKHDEAWIKEDIEILLNSSAEAKIRCLLLSYEFISPDYNKDIGKIKEIVKAAGDRGVYVLFAPSRMYLFLDEEIQRRMRRARMKHFPQRKGQPELQIIDVPKEWWDVPKNLTIRRGIQNASNSAKVFAGQIAKNRDIPHYRMQFSLMCEVVEREALQNHKIIIEVEGKDSKALLKALRCENGPCKDVTFPYIRPEEMPHFLERIRLNLKTQDKKPPPSLWKQIVEFIFGDRNLLSSENKNLFSVLENVQGGIVVLIKPWKPSLPEEMPVEKTEPQEEKKVFEVPSQLKEKIDAERKKKRCIGNPAELDNAHEHLQNSLKNRLPLGMASIRSHVFIQMVRDYIYHFPGIEPQCVKITYSDGAEGKPFPLFSLSVIKEPEGKFFTYPVGLVSLRHMKFDKDIERSLIRNREIQLKDTSADQEDIAYRRTYEHIEEFLKFLNGKIKEKEASLGLQALLIRENSLKDKQWDGLALHIFQSTGLEAASVGAYRAIVELIGKYRGRLIVVPTIKPGEVYEKAERWY